MLCGAFTLRGVRLLFVGCVHSVTVSFTSCELHSLCVSCNHVYRTHLRCELHSLCVSCDHFYRTHLRCVPFALFKLRLIFGALTQWRIRSLSVAFTFCCVYFTARFLISNLV